MRTMRKLAVGISTSILFAAMMAGVAHSQGAGSQGVASHHQVTKAEYDRWKTELSNWGRWGKDDEIGALNLITPATRRRAAALVRDGVAVSLASDADTVRGIDNPEPYERTMIDPERDRVAVMLHGMA